MTIRPLTENDKQFVMSIDKHADEQKFLNRIYTKSGYVLCCDGQCVGTMFHTVLWDNLPFLNFIFVKEEFRGKGCASRAMLDWESEMRKQGYKMTLVSTQVDETAQHFYRKLGYVDCGALLLSDTPLEQPMEMFMRKIL